MSAQIFVRTTGRRPVWSRAWTFALLVGLLIVLMAGASSPSPLYVLYQAKWHLSSAAITGMFAIYVATLLVTLLVGGRLSDRVGRRPVLFTTFAITAAAMLVFASASSLGEILLARAIQGIGTGLGLSAIGAALIDQQPPSRRQFGALVNAIGSSISLALGALGSGVLVQFAPDPTRLVFAIMFVLCVAAIALIVLFPESVERQSGVIGSMVPTVRVPVVSRAAFLAAIPVMVATWALGGFMLSLGPSVTAAIFGLHSHLTGGLVVMVFTGAGSAGVLALRNQTPQREMRIASVLLLAGSVVALVALANTWIVVFAVGLLGAGLGFGAGFHGAVRLVSAGVSVADRGALFSAIFVISYLGFSLPALVAGELTDQFGLQPVAVAYAVFVAVLACGSLVAVRGAAPECPNQAATARG